MHINLPACHSPRDYTDCHLTSMNRKANMRVCLAIKIWKEENYLSAALMSVGNILMQKEWFVAESRETERTKSEFQELRNSLSQIPKCCELGGTVQCLAVNRRKGHILKDFLIKRRPSSFDFILTKRKENFSSAFSFIPVRFL